MVAVKIDRKTGKCEIIDDAEETPGSSRQITRFRQYCLPILEEEIKKDKTLKTTNTNNIRFNEYGFDNACSENHPSLVGDSKSTLNYP